MRSLQPTDTKLKKSTSIHHLSVASLSLPREGETCGDDLKVVVEWNIAADESVEQDPQGPDGGGLAVVATVQQPLGWGVNPGT